MVFGMHRLTDTQTDTPENTMPPAPKVSGSEGLKNNSKAVILF